MAASLFRSQNDLAARSAVLPVSRPLLLASNHNVFVLKMIGAVERARNNAKHHIFHGVLS